MSGASEVNRQAAGNRTRKTAQRNVRSKRTVASPREGLAHGGVEPIKPDQRLVMLHDSSNSVSSERTSASSTTGTSGRQLKETSTKNTGTAVVSNTDGGAQPSDDRSNSASLTDNLEDTSLDLDEQSIFTYVFLYW